jgi:hypothetical protein
LRDPESLGRQGFAVSAVCAAVCIRFARACVFAGQRPRDGAPSHSQCAARPRKCRSAACMFCRSGAAHGASAPRRVRPGSVAPRPQSWARRAGGSGWCRRPKVDRVDRHSGHCRDGRRGRMLCPSTRGARPRSRLLRDQDAAWPCSQHRLGSGACHSFWGWGRRVPGRAGSHGERGLRRERAR